MPKKKISTREPVVHDIELSVVGLQHRLTTSTRRWLSKSVAGDPIFCKLVREKDNIHDENAVKVVIKEGTYKDLHMGYVPRGIAEPLSALLDQGKIQDVLLSVTEIDVDKGTAEGRLQFTSTKRQALKGKKKTA